MLHSSGFSFDILFVQDAVFAACDSSLLAKGPGALQLQSPLGHLVYQPRGIILEERLYRLKFFPVTLSEAGGNRRGRLEHRHNVLIIARATNSKELAQPCTAFLPSKNRPLPNGPDSMLFPHS